MVRDFEAAKDDLIRALMISQEECFLDAHGVQSLTIVLYNLYQMGEFARVAELNPYVTDAFMTNPSALTAEDGLTVGRLSAFSLFFLGELAQANASTAKKAGLDDSIEQQIMLEISSMASPEELSASAGSDDTLEGAVNADDAEKVKRILAEGADPDAMFNNWTPLMLLGLGSGNPEIARLLLDAGADPNITGEANMTALIAAVNFAENPELVQLLIDSGADANQRSPAGWNALMLAARNGTSSNIVSYLLDAGADPDVVTNDGLKPFL